MDDGAGNAGATGGPETGGGQGQTGQTGIANSLDTVFQDIKNALARTLSDGNRPTYSGRGDRYVTGDVNWAGYDLTSLVSMVAEPANPAQVDTVAGLWRTHGASITQGAEDLTQSLTTLLNYWQGSAATMASDAVTNTANWISAVGETAAKLANSVEDAGGALRSAQSAMPAGPTTGFMVGYNPAAGGAAVTAAAGGPLGAAAGAMVGGLTSVFGAGAEQTASKQQAVQTMQRYEQAAMTIDSSTPRFAAPVTWGIGGGGSTGVSGVGVGVGGSGVGGMSGIGSAGQGLAQSLDQGTVPSFATSSTGRWNALTGGGGRLGGIGIGTGGSGGGSFGAGAGLLGAGLGDGAEAATNRQKSGVASAAGNEAGGVAARADSTVLENVDGRNAVGAPGVAGMGGQGARGGSDGEYKRRIPYEDEPFTTGLKAVPPVIGLNAVD